MSANATDRDRQRFRDFVAERVEPFAGAWDRDEAVPDSVIAELAKHGHLGAVVPTELGGTDLDPATLGALHEEMARGSASLQSLLTVHGMASLALRRFGDEAQRRRWLPALATGETLAGFALSEPEAGSDAAAARTRAREAPGGWVLDGRKSWIGFGQRADAFLVYALCEGGPATFWVEAASPGLSVAPTRGMLGFRAGMLAELTLSDCFVPRESRVGPAGGGFAFVVNACLDLGRFCVASGGVGIAQACLDASLHRARHREQFGAPLAEQPLVKRLLTRMVAKVEAARGLCRRAAELRRARDPEALEATLVAKYFAAEAARECATDAVQLHGAAGCTAESPVQRYYRDAKILELIEGNTQLLEGLIADQRLRSGFSRRGGPDG